MQRFWSKVNFDGPVPAHRPDLGSCWIWTASVDGTEYGKFWYQGKLVPAHRFAYEITGDRIPDGLVIDHLCRVHRCVRKSHLEPVTEQVNILRGIGPSAREATQTHCPRGHPYDDANTYIEQTRRGEKRHCRTCRDAARKRLAQTGYDKAYRLAHGEEMRQYARDWNSRNPGKQAEYQRNYKLRKKAAA